MGFRDLFAFNLALLSKQAWRLFNQDLLAYKIFKARYFPASNFMNVAVKAKSFYCWKSAAANRSVLHRGLRWQVGNGTSIKVWQDNWLPRAHFFLVVSPPPVGWGRETTVDKLFIDDTHFWNEALLGQIICQEEIDPILSISLSFQDVSDKVICHFERDGRFLFRSAY